MTTPTREAVFSALFERVKAIVPNGAASNVNWVSPDDPLASGKLRTASRALRHWEDVRPEEQPYLGQVQKPETWERTRGLPPKRTLEAWFYVYVSTGAQSDPTVVPSVLLNPILDALEDALAPDQTDGPDAVCTLGGLVSHAWISGVETSEGSLGNQEVAMVFVNILMP